MYSLFTGILLLALIGLTSCSVVPTRWNVPPANIINNGDGTYSVTRDARTVFSSVESLESRVQEDIADYCQKNNLDYEIVSKDIDDATFLGSNDFSSVSVVFKAWPKSNRNYTIPATVAPLGKPTPQTIEPGVSTPSSTDRMYEDLMKLDELRQKGILSEEEFTKEKQKVLDRYN